MTTEPAYNAHYSCAYCHGLKARQDIIHFNGHAICREGDCLAHMKGKQRVLQTDRFAGALVVPRSVGYYDKG